MKMRRNKIVSAFLALLLVLTVLGPCHTAKADSWAEPMGDEGFWAQVEDDDTLTITGFDGDLPSGKLVVPSKIEGYTVTKIAYGAFEDMSNISSVKLPKTVKEIEPHAFDGTKWLENQQKKNPQVIINGFLIDGKKCTGKITISKKVKTIIEGAFEGNTKITSVTVPGKVKTIKFGAFRDCTSLKTLKLKKGVKTLGPEAFAGCKALSSVTISSSVKTMGTAFTDTPWLQKKAKNSANGLVIINNILVDGSTAQGTVEIPDGVTAIDYGAFKYGQATRVKFPDSIKTIGPCAFYYCDLESIDIPEGVTTLQFSTFYGCKNLKQVKLPKSLESLEYLCFGECKQLNTITIPASVTKLEYPFWSAPFWKYSLVIYTPQGSAAEEHAKKMDITVKYTK